MSRISRGTPAGNAYLDLKNQAKLTGRPTQELLQLYVLEGFLARLAASDVRDGFVLKGGVLLAALGTRRPTKTSISRALIWPTPQRPCWPSSTVCSRHRRPRTMASSSFRILRPQK